MKRRRAGSAPTATPWWWWGRLVASPWRLALGVLILVVAVAPFAVYYASRISDELDAEADQAYGGTVDDGQHGRRWQPGDAVNIRSEGTATAVAQAGTDSNADNAEDSGDPERRRPAAAADDDDDDAYWRNAAIEERAAENEQTGGRPDDAAAGKGWSQAGAGDAEQVANDAPRTGAPPGGTPAARPRRPADLPPVAAPYMEGFDFVDSIDGEMAVVTRRLTVGALGPEASFLLAAWHHATTDLGPWRCVFLREADGAAAPVEEHLVDAIESRSYERDFHRVVHCPLPPMVHARLLRMRRHVQAAAVAARHAAGDLPDLGSVIVALRGPHPFAPMRLAVTADLPLSSDELAAARQPESFYVCISALHQLWWPDYTLNFLVEAFEYWIAQGARGLTLYLRMADLPILADQSAWKATLRHYMDLGFLTVVDARPLNQTHLFYGGQELQLNDCFLRLRDRPRLVIFGDLDELFWLRRGNGTLRDYLSELYRTAVVSDASTGRFAVAYMPIRQLTLVTDSCEAPVSFMASIYSAWQPDMPVVHADRKVFDEVFANKNVQKALARMLESDLLRWPHLILVDPTKDPYDRPKYVANTRNILSANIHVPETLPWLRSAHIDVPDSDVVKLHARLLPIEKVVCRNIRLHRSTHTSAAQQQEVYFYELSGPLYADYMRAPVDAARHAIRSRIIAQAREL